MFNLSSVSEPERKVYVTWMFNDSDSEVSTYCCSIVLCWSARIEIEWQAHKTMVIFGSVGCAHRTETLHKVMKLCALKDIDMNNCSWISSYNVRSGSIDSTVLSVIRTPSILQGCTQSHKSSVIGDFNYSLANTTLSCDLIVFRYLQSVLPVSQCVSWPHRWNHAVPGFCKCSLPNIMWFNQAPLTNQVTVSFTSVL